MKVALVCIAKIDDFIPHNHNSIEDLTAFKFYNS